MRESQRKRLLITDLDNTIWDWFEAWYQSFSAMLSCLTKLSGIPASELEVQIRQIHQLRGTTEYSNLLSEVPALIAAAWPEDPAVAFDEALHTLHSKRKSATHLYPGVRNTLNYLKGADVHVVAYTESIAYWSEWRIRHTGLDGVIDVLYSAPDHDLPAGRSFKDLRKRPPAEYGLHFTQHRHVERGVTKPDVAVIQSILEAQDCEPCNAVYVGDSLMKDVAMAQAASVLDVHAKYGAVQERSEYDLLRRVSHWSDEEVERERRLVSAIAEIVPSFTCDRTFDQILPLFDSAWS